MPYVLRCPYGGCIYICNCYIFFLDWSLDHCVVSFLVFCNDLYFKSILSHTSIATSTFFWSSICMEYPPLTFSLCTLGLRWISCYYCCLVTQSFLTLRNPVECTTPGFPVFHYLLEFAHLFCSFPLGSTCWSPCSLRLSKVFSSNTFWKCQFFSTQPSLWSNCHICR